MDLYPREKSLLAALVLFAALFVSGCGGGDNSAAAAADANACTQGPAGTSVDTPFCRGKANFHDRTLAGLGGNGRACSDCHMDTGNFQLTPAAAQAAVCADDHDRRRRSAVPSNRRRRLPRQRRDRA
jgi:hypothetical protein